MLATAVLLLSLAFVFFFVTYRCSMAQSILIAFVLSLLAISLSIGVPFSAVGSDGKWSFFASSRRMSGAFILPTEPSWDALLALKNASSFRLLQLSLHSHNLSSEIKETRNITARLVLHNITLGDARADGVLAAIGTFKRDADFAALSLFNLSVAIEILIDKCVCYYLGDGEN